MIDPYEAIVDFYDAELGSASPDVALFARNAGAGPLLVLGCGTGRVCRLLTTDRAVTGLDRSEAMLARARQLPSSPGGPPGAGIRWVHGDMRAFELGMFGEIFIPHGAFSFLHGRADPLSCLQSCARSLPTGGRLTIDVPAPDLELLAVPYTPEQLAWQGQVGGRAGRRTREVHRRAMELRVDLVDRYFLDEQFLTTSILRLQLAFPRELEWLCEAAGFYVDALVGDYAGGPIRDGCDRIVVKAVRC